VIEITDLNHTDLNRPTLLNVKAKSKKWWWWCST